jgi:hypothetical protein
VRRNATPGNPVKTGLISPGNAERRRDDAP